jgi:hypothetical protein
MCLRILLIVEQDAREEDPLLHAQLLAFAAALLLVVLWWRLGDGAWGDRDDEVGLIVFVSLEVPLHFLIPADITVLLEAPPSGRAIDESPCTNRWKSTRCCLRIILGVVRLTCLLAPEEEGGDNRFCVRGERNREPVLSACKCALHPCAVVQKTLRTVEVTHLEAVNGRRASLDIALVAPINSLGL